MENQLTTSNQDQRLPLNFKEIKIAEILWEINLLVSYPLSDVFISAWARTINSLYSTIELSVLKDLIDEMKLGNVEWDKQMGIQNICIGLKGIGIIDDKSKGKTGDTEEFRKLFGKTRQPF